MKALSIRNPWAWLVAAGRKTVETREWSPRYPGLRAAQALVGQRIAIHASQAVDRRALDRLRGYGVSFLGADFTPGIIGTARLVEVRPMRAGDVVPAFDARMPLTGRIMLRHFDESGLTALVLADAVLLPVPIPCTGRLGFWDVPAELAR